MSDDFLDPLADDEQTRMFGEDPVFAGRYRVIRDLGQGAMGKVLLAVDTQLDNLPVAIKVPAVLVAQDAQAVRRMQQEALLARRLSHPNIVTLRTIEHGATGVFLVMDYVEGQTLQDLLGNRETLSETEVVSFFEPLARALDYAHEEKVIHRDIKPSNILIRQDGRPYLTDFGIARELKDSLTRLTGKSSSGTLPYMSPEQLYGEAPSPAQDIYSLAATMYECLAGHPPFFRGELAVQIAQKEPPVPNQSDSALVARIMKALAKKPGDRPKSCAAILEATAAAPPTVAPPPAVPPPVASPSVVPPPLPPPLPRQPRAASKRSPPAAKPRPTPPQRIPATPERPAASTPRPPVTGLLGPRSLSALTVLCVVLGMLQALLFPFYPSIAPFSALLLLGALLGHIQHRRQRLARVLTAAEASGTGALLRAPGKSPLWLAIVMWTLAGAAAFGMLILLLEDFDDFFDLLDDEGVGVGFFFPATILQFLFLTLCWIAFELILRRHRRDEAELISLARRDPAWLEEQQQAMRREWSGTALIGKILVIPFWPLVFPIGQLHQLRRHLDWEKKNGVPELDVKR